MKNGGIGMNKYLPRIVDEIISDKLSYMGGYLL